METSAPTIRIAMAAEYPVIRAAYAAWSYSHSVSNDDIIYVIELGSELAGMVRRTLEHETTMLRGMQIAPRRQRQGLGTRLLQRFARDLADIECFCLPYTHVIDFYCQVGFELIPEQTIPQFLQQRLAEYRGRGLSVVAMRRPSQV